MTKSAGGTDDRTSLSLLWWQGTCGSDGVWWAEDDIDDMAVYYAYGG